MALIQFSALVNKATGKLNGSVISHNKGGSYVRNKGIVANPRTSIQMQRRMVLGSISSLWRSLSQKQRNSFINAGDALNYTNIFGEQKKLSGFGLFMQTNLNMSVLGEAPHLSFKGQTAFSEFSVADVIADTEAFTATFSIADAMPNARLVIEATPAQSAGISNANNKFRYFQTHASSVTSLNLFADYETQFGAIVANTKTFLRFSLIDRETGMRSVALVMEVLFVEA